MSDIKYKIIKNYIKFIAHNDINYINKIINLIEINCDDNITGYYFQKGGNNNIILDFIIQNIELIVEDIELFNKILSIIKKHDNLMIKLNPNYKKFNYDDDILKYLDEINDNELIYV